MIPSLLPDLNRSKWFNASLFPLVANCIFSFVFSFIVCIFGYSWGCLNLACSSISSKVRMECSQCVSPAALIILTKYTLYRMLINIVISAASCPIFMYTTVVYGVLNLVLYSKYCFHTAFQARALCQIECEQVKTLLPCKKMQFCLQHWPLQVWFHRKYNLLVNWELFHDTESLINAVSLLTCEITIFHLPWKANIV